MEPENDIEIQETIKRHWLLSILCVVFFVHSAILAMLFLSSIFFNTWLTEVINNFNENNSFGNSRVLFFSMIGFLLYGASFIGTWYLWHLKKKGLYILSISVFSILLFTYIIGADSLINSVIYIILLLLLALFYRKLN